MRPSSHPTAVPTPPWAKIQDVDAWPTEAVSDAALGYQAGVPAHWGREPVVENLPTETVHTYRGPSPADWLSIRRLEGATPSADLSDWVEVSLGLTGFPVPPPAKALTAPPRLLEWSGLQPCPELAARLQADDLRVADGVAICPLDTGASLMHVYVLLARIATRAWSITLAIFSACLVNAPEALVLANDHCRAAAVFGKLRLGGPETISAFANRDAGEIDPAIDELT